ncbi:FAD:protein FMN transferase [Roseateles sp. YR242]|uniref:FAD:protein FMN transferase n=1 Tax=Roseateles sp. YR242 TaxID=1855305 RepID=UPI002101965E|nr:FAD:protein FMN transferase [Roseateles sp. YR242]
MLVPLQIEGAPPSLDQAVHRLAGATMGTTWSVAVIGPAGLRLSPIETAIMRVCEDVIAEMSQWTPDSLLSRFNAAPAGSSHALPEGFARVLAAALQIAETSGGAYDPSAGELVSMWGFGPSGPSARWPRHDDAGFRPPSEADCAQAHCGWHTLVWHASEQRLIQPGGLTLDLSAIAKGDAVDRVSALLTSLGLPNHLVEIGGELRGAGLKPEGQPWWVDLEPPAEACGLAPMRVALHGLAIATSGDYRKFYLDAQGQRRSHTVDPRDRRPVAHGLASVTVIHDSAMWADGWSTALMVLGPAEGLALAERLGLAALLVTRRSGGGFDEQLSSALRELLI